MRIKSVRIDGKVPVGGITLKVSDAVSWSPSAVRVPITVTLISLASVAEELAVNVSEVAGWPETRGLVAKTACTPLGNPETENWTAKLVLPDCEVMLRPARVETLPPWETDSAELFKVTEKLANCCC